MNNCFRLLRILADGQFHSGEELGHALNVSRAAVWKQLQQLKSLNIEVFSVRGRGYRLAQPVEILDQQRILQELDEHGHRALAQLEIHQQIDSTNRYLVAGAQRGLPSGHACVAERQTQGRGRRGKAWFSPFGANLYLSLLWRFSSSPAALGGLSLAIGVAVARALDELGGVGIGLKWPNDLIYSGRKLGGILLELSGEGAGPCHVVIGVGVNVRMVDPEGTIDQPWINLDTVIPGISRNRLAGLVLKHMLHAIREFSTQGLSAFADQWKALDTVAGRIVDVHSAEGTVSGTAVGIDEAGALLVDSGGRRLRFSSGEVSLRLQ